MSDEQSSPSPADDPAAVRAYVAQMAEELARMAERAERPEAAEHLRRAAALVV